MRIVGRQTRQFGAHPRGFASSHAARNALPLTSMSDHPAELLAGSSGNSLHIWRVKDVSSSPCLPSTRPGSLELGVVAWNRNNKVVAGARSDGSVVLSYSSGEPMSTLRPASATGRPGGVSDSLPVAMAWGAGSKRLAVGLRSGELHVHDMMTKVGYLE